ncbi:MAG: DsbA family oxidoreductase [Acidimicrobiia bacterium]|nr:DsbA family oxidoreductase [Acidimicrobiia bacterium]
MPAGGKAGWPPRCGNGPRPHRVGVRVRLDVWSDVVCPWCYLGKRRLEQAIELLGADPGDVEVRWRAFQLDPRATATPGDLRTALERKYGSGAFDVMTQRLGALGTVEGIDYRFDRALRVGTADAHRLMAWAWAEGGAAAQGRLAEALFAAYFTDGANIADHATLVRLADEAGIVAEGPDAATVLEGDAYRAEVDADLAAAAERGITGVPAFVVADSFVIPGAQEPETLARLLRRVAA